MLIQTKCILLISLLFKLLYNVAYFVMIFRTEVKSLSEGLYDAKAQYVTIFEENKLLQSKLDFVSKPKDQQDMENELRTEYEKKLNKCKYLTMHFMNV